MPSFSEKMQDLLNKGVAASRDALAKAGAQAQAWGEMGVLKFEVIQLRSQAERLVAKLGAEAYAAFAERGQASLSADAPGIRAQLEKIAAIEKEIDAKEEAFRRLGGQESDLDKAGGPD